MGAPELRPMQIDLINQIDNAWAAGHKVVMPVAPTGSGKTVVLSHLIADNRGYSLAVAHRQELVSQISAALARHGLHHSIITSGANKSSVARMISSMHVIDFGQSYVTTGSRIAVAGVDTMLKCQPSEFAKYDFGVMDEAHHVLADNKWGRAVALLTNARRWLMPTATPKRADGKGLGRHASGLVDAMVLAAGMRDHINGGWLTDYKIYCPVTSRLHREDIKVSEATGEFSAGAAAAAVRKAKIVGDVVENYIKFADGKTAVVFCVDVEESERQAAEFRAKGIPAKSLDGTKSDTERAGVLRELRESIIKVVTNVDLFGEGFDLPAIEAVIFARPTMSYSLYVQQFGRVLRLLLNDMERVGYNLLTDAQRLAVIAGSAKPFGIVIDMVGNVEAHGLPDRPIAWSLDDVPRGKRGIRDPDEIPLRRCLECLQPYERVLTACPYCGAEPPPPADRSGPEHVEGDLCELSPDILKRLRGEISKIDGAVHVPRGLPAYVAKSIITKHNARQDAQRNLRNQIAWWAGWREACGDSEREGYKRFWYKYGVDVATAQTLGAAEAEELARRVCADLLLAGVDSGRDAFSGDM